MGLLAVFNIISILLLISVFFFPLLCLLWVYSPFSWFLGWKLIDFRLTLISVITVNISLSTDLLVSHKF